MDMASIRTFLTVVRLGNITEAARFLFLTQSTVSQRIKLLEKELGITLITRSKGTRKISLTPAGIKFLHIAKKWEELLAETQNLNTEYSKVSFTIGAVDSISGYVLPPLYRHLQHRSSKLSFRIRTHQSLELYTLLEHKEIDVAFAQKERDITNFHVQTLFKEPMVLITKSDLNVHQEGSMISNHHLDPEAELYIDWGTDFQSWHAKWWGTEGTQGIEVDTGLLLISLLKQAEGWAVAPVSMAKTFKNMYGINVYQITDPPPPRTCFMVQRSSQDNRTDLFNEYLQESLAEMKEIVENVY